MSRGRSAYRSCFAIARSLARPFVRSPLPPPPRRVFLDYHFSHTQTHLSFVNQLIASPNLLFFYFKSPLSHPPPHTNRRGSCCFLIIRCQKKGKEKKRRRKGKGKKKTPPPHTKKVSFFSVENPGSTTPTDCQRSVFQTNLVCCRLLFSTTLISCAGIFLLLTINYCRVCGFISPSSGNCFH